MATDNTNKSCVPDDSLWNEKQAAAWLNISPRSLQRLPADVLPFVRIGQLKRYEPAAVRAVVARLRVSTAA